MLKFEELQEALSKSMESAAELILADRAATKIRAILTVFDFEKVVKIFNEYNEEKTTKDELIQEAFALLLYVSQGMLTKEMIVESSDHFLAGYNHKEDEFTLFYVAEVATN